MIEIIGAFVLGFLLGMGSVIGIVYHLGSKSLEKKKAELKERVKKAESIESRMKRVKEITAEQVDLAQRADGPQKNSLDGKYKNGIIREMKRLDEEKNDILKSILTDGHDPELTTIDEAGVVSKMKLSEYMAYMGIKMDPPKSQQPKVEQIGKFTVIRGGLDDDGDGGETTH